MSCIFEKEVKQQIRCAFGAQCVIFSTHGPLCRALCADGHLLEEVDHRRRCRATALPQIYAG
eukprot:12455741-Prorocentrum_lima.AAC.1